MNSLKKFESFINGSEKIYWMLPTDGRLTEALKKLNCPKSFIIKILRTELIKRSKYIYIGFHGGDYLDENGWGWVGGESGYFYNDEGFIFNGTIDIPQYELDADKYNL